MIVRAAVVIGESMVEDVVRERGSNFYDRECLLFQNRLHRAIRNTYSRSRDDGPPVLSMHRLIQSTNP
jgi:hypothetical protein